jgi:hypothetical protein
MVAINSSDRIAATLYSLGKWFVSGIYIKETVMMMMIIIIIVKTFTICSS